MKKRIISLMLTAAMALSLCACGGNNAAAPAAAAPADGAAPAAEAPADDAAPADAAPAGDAVDTSDFVKMDLKYATFLTETNIAQPCIDLLAEKLEQKAPGYFTITTFANGTLLGATDIYDGVVNGIADMGLVQPSLQPARFPVSQLPEYPGIAYNSSEVAGHVWTDFLRNNDIDEYKDVHVLWGWGAGPGAIFLKNPVHKLSDFNGVEIRTTGMASDVVKAYGGVPSSMEFSEVYEALRSGLVDGCYTNFGAGGFIKIQEVLGYCLITPFANSVYTYVMNKAKWDSMPAAQQELFTQCVDEVCEEYGFVYGDDGYKTNQSNLDCIDGLKELLFAEGDLAEEMKAATADLTGKYVEQLEAQGIPGQQYFDELEQLAAKYNASFTWDDYKALFQH